MGYIPLFIALLGLVLLYTIYTYNLIKPRKARLTQVIDDMAENSRNRKNIILEHDRSNGDSPLKEVAEMLKKASTDRFQSYRKEEEFLSSIETAISGIDDNDLRDKLQAINEKQALLIKKLQSVSNDYNSFIEKAPASIVASVFGFRQF